jgi:hypothetical protein
VGVDPAASSDSGASSALPPGNDSPEPPGDDSPEPPGTAGLARTPLTVVQNEFASVTLSLDTAGHSARLHVQDNETGAAILLSAIELASLCLATSEDRLGWLRVGLYRGEPE